MAPAGDPLDWSVDEVVEALCKATDWWKIQRPNSLLPDPEPFERNLREQEINGYALLTYLSDQTLKDEFGIKALGRRAAVSWAIDKLREQSPKYVEHLAAQRSVFAGESASQSLARGVTGWLGNVSPPSEVFRQGQATPTYDSHLPTILETEAETPGLVGGSAKRAGETIVQDGHGRKRRKLNLVESAAMPPPARKLGAVNAFPLHRKKFPVDRIFYGDAAFGQVLEEDDDLDFQHFGEVPAAIDSYVYRQFAHFVRSPERKELLQQNGKKVVAILPYRSKILPEGHPRSATVIESGDQDAQATRQDALRLRSSIPYDSNIPYDDDDGHEFYSLAERWSKENDTVLPALGDSDDSEGYSSSFEAELEAEERERVLEKPMRKQLSKADVVTIINDRIQELVDIWATKKLPMRQKTARTLWRKGRRPRDRLMLRAVAEENIKAINKRLNKLKDAIVDEVWHQKEEVLWQCATLEESVWQREGELWHISVWELKTEPPRVFAGTPLRRRRDKAAQREDDNNLGEGEEAGDWVNSESELSSDGIDNFIEADRHAEEALPEMHHADEASQSLGESRDNTPAPDVVSLPDASDSEIAGETTAEDNDIDVFDTLAPAPATPKGLQIRKRDSAPRSTRSIIDLTALSDGSDPLSPVPVQKRSTLSHPTVIPESQSSNNRWGGDPENSTVDEIIGWNLNELQERNDKKRLVLKLLRTSTDTTEYKNLRSFVKAVTQKILSDQVRLAMGAICRRERMNGMADKEWQILDRLVRLYTCWSTVRAKYWRCQPDKIEPALVKLMKNLDTPQSRHDQDGFFKFVISVLTKITGSKSETVPDEPVSEEEIEPEPADTPHKKRKKKVKQSASARTQRKRAQERFEAQAEIERVFQERVNLTQSDSDRLIVNLGEYDKKGAIYINQGIGSYIKTHQIEGIRFMWREIIEAGHVDPQGCLLAHTMGLGKTMQAITLLVTIAEASNSPQERIRSQIPEDLRRMQALILCPASLVSNWIDELRFWMSLSAPAKIGKVRHINAEFNPVERVAEIDNWHRKGGVLVMSYEMFRRLLTGSALVNQRDSLEQKLLEGPSIIVADEAHKMKSTNSSLRTIVERFRSKSRVALTGSPLANNLVEYWSMIDWISPGYLGSLKEFRAHFVEPIQEGLYKDSSRYEHRRALKKLRVLKSEIDPKISRADITVLKDDLKSKVEFLITVPLTKLQKDLYELCVQQVAVVRKKKLTTLRMWQWLHILTMLCNHPSAFLKRLKDGKSQKEDITDDGEITDLHDLALEDQDLDPKAELPSSIIGKAMELFDQTTDLESPCHSFKTDILMRILETAKEASDQVLIFSHHIPTLDYLENLLGKRRQRFARLDGTTPMAHRPQLLREFNSGTYDVFLISTRAGGTGFNLPGANRVVMFDFSFNPQNEEQAIGRAYRLGQEKEVFVYRLVTGGTFEPKVWNMALFKTQLASRVVDTRNPERHAHRMREYFFEPVPVEQEDLTEHQGKDRKVLDKILAWGDEGHDHGIRAITTTETLMTEDGDAALDEEEKAEVEKMIRAERLRKDNPIAWEQYLKDNPGLEDNRAQASLFREAAARMGPAPFPAFFPQTQSGPAPFIEFGVAPSSTQPAHAGFPGRPAPQSDEHPSYDAGINNVGPMPASMRHHLSLKPTQRESHEVNVRASPESGNPVPTEGASLGRNPEPLTLDETSLDAGVNHPSPEFRAMRPPPASMPLMTSSPAFGRGRPIDDGLSNTRDPGLKSSPLPSLANRGGRSMSSASRPGWRSPVGTQPNRFMTSPLQKEVATPINFSDFSVSSNTANEGRSAYGKETRNDPVPSAREIHDADERSQSKTPNDGQFGGEGVGQLQRGQPSGVEREGVDQQTRSKRPAGNPNEHAPEPTQEPPSWLPKTYIDPKSFKRKET